MVALGGWNFSGSEKKFEHFLQINICMLRNKEEQERNMRRNAEINKMGLNFQNLRNYKHFQTHLYIHVDPLKSLYF